MQVRWHLCAFLIGVAGVAGVACSSSGGGGPQTCEIEDTSSPPDYVTRLGCEADMNALASSKLDTSIPGARSVKVVLDRGVADELFFQNSSKYPIHHDFVSAHRSGNGMPLVPRLAEFNQTEYYAPDRRFLLGAVTYYEGPELWALEVAPYDAMTSEMIGQLFTAVRTAAFFADELVFHPTSDAVALEALALPADVPVRSTDFIYEGVDYQPLNLASAQGRLRFLQADQLSRTYLDYREIVVLDHVPNDISVVSGIVTEEFQTPLSHINVLSRNRGTPNMGLRGATSNEELRALDGAWVELSVGASGWSVREVSEAEADAWWQANKPEPVVLPAPDLTVTDLRDVEDIVDETQGELRDMLLAAIPAFGGKAAHYSVLANTEGVPARKAFAIPGYHYVKFMEDNGFFERIRGWLQDPGFNNDPAVRDAYLAELRTDMHSARVDADFQRALRAKLEADYPGLTMRFRSSTNSEDLDGFPCAGCYESHTGDPEDWTDVLDAIRDTWASIWLFRTFEERAYNSIDHFSVVMALLVHHNFPDEEANGVAVTANPFDPSGLQPGFYVNVQFGGDVEVVHPPAGTTSDQFLYLYDEPGQPIIYLSHSNLVPEGETVLTNAQIYELGTALDAIHDRFSPAYGPASGNDGWYAMDVELKFDGEPGEVAPLWIKQARPYPAPADEP